MSAVSIGPGPGHFSEPSRPRVVVLDDYEDCLRRTADWGAVQARADVAFHTEPLKGDALFEAIVGADAIVQMRDRTAFDASLIGRLPNLKLFIYTGPRNTRLDFATLAARGIPVANTEAGSSKESTAELTWALILAAAKRLEAYLNLVRAGRWRDGKALPVVLSGERLGLVGFGGIGQKVGAVGKAFGMEVVTWSPHMTEERAASGGARSVSLDELLSSSRVVSLHLVPSADTRKLLDARRLGTMRADAILVNTARSALIDMAALDAALQEGRPGVAALDVYDEEPLPASFALARRENVVLTPHLGFVNDAVFAKFGPGVVESLLAWLDGKPVPRRITATH